MGPGMTKMFILLNWLKNKQNTTDICGKEQKCWETNMIIVVKNDSAT